MKDIHVIICTFVFGNIFIAGSCDSNNKDIFETEFVKLKGDLNNTDESINLGDTLKFSLTLPNIITGSTQTVTVSSLQEAFYGYRIFRIDTVNRTVFGDAKLKFYLNPGIDNSCQTCFTGFAYMQKTALTYGCTLNIIPEIRGVFYLEIIPQPGRLKVNNNYEAGLLINFNVPDKHHTMLDSYFGNNGFLAGAIERDQRGYGIYGFRVK